MELLAEWNLFHKGEARTIQLLFGDLAHLPAEHSVDVLVVSAFQNDYVPTRTSLIGALADAGLSVAGLSKNKKNDFRTEFSCWLSYPIDHAFAFRYLLCIESGWRGAPAEITDDLFRALAPYLLSDFANASVAMPIIGAGDQRNSPVAMMKSILDAAITWIERGLQLRKLKIVAHSKAIANQVLEVFIEQRQKHATIQRTQSLASPEHKDLKSGAMIAPEPEYDAFISYCHSDQSVARKLCDAIKRYKPAARIFLDTSNLVTGASWMNQLSQSLDRSRRVVALYTPDYWSSKFCTLEINAAFLRQMDSGETILFPIYFREAPVPYMFRTVQFIDCREADETKMEQACASLSNTL